jgi:type III restriction enzyme
LAVNQDGDRIRDEHINVLTVIANEGYENYVSHYQAEVESEFGIEGLPPRPANARKRGVAQLRKEFMLKPEFKELWERIKQRTRYAVKIDSEKLIADIITELEKEEIRPPHVVVTKARMEATGEAFVAYQTAQRTVNIEVEGKNLPNITEVISSLLERTTPPVRLTRQTLLEIYKGLSGRQQKAALENLYEFSTVAARIIKAKLAEQLVKGIQYEKLNAWYEMTQFQDIPSWEDNLVASPHSLYDNVIYDSDIEKTFVESLEHRDDVKLYVKLPGWFTVPTPIGEYNPDWAIVLEQRDEFGQAAGEDLLYLVRETKSTTDLDQLRPEEKSKILCGEKHFKGALGVNYKVVTNIQELD